MLAYLNFHQSRESYFEGHDVVVMKFGLSQHVTIVCVSSGIVSASSITHIWWIQDTLGPGQQVLVGRFEGIRQYDSSDTGHSDNVNITADHQEPA